MKSPYSRIATLLVLLFVPMTARAQEPTIWLAGIEMRIGMPRQAVIDKLAEGHLQLLKFSEKDDSWVIAGDKAVAGLVAFRNGKLDYATKEWAISHSNECSSLADKLHAVLAEAVARGESVAGIATTLKRQPRMTIQTTELTFKRRIVYIEVIDAEDHGASQIAVKETIK